MPAEVTISTYLYYKNAVVCSLLVVRPWHTVGPGQQGNTVNCVQEM